LGTFALRAAGSFALLAALALPCPAATYSANLAQPGVVWISDDSKPAALPESEMRNKEKSFVPDLLVITAGSSVRFPNDDPFFHSIYSEGGPDAFDIGFYDSGPGKVVAFPKPGVNLVRCHIHGTMHATIVVVDGPFAQTRDAGEKYTLTGVRPGSHILHSWSLAGGETTTPVKL
jgi:plastocyanin